MPAENAKISVVVPLYNEASNLELLYQRVQEACAQSAIDYEILFVDDGSTDNSLDIIKELRSRDNRVGYICLSRNFGHQNAIFAGMTYASGDACITMDADLQHPPSLIPEMIALWRKGAEVVYTTKRQPNLPPLKHLIVKNAYWFISRISGLKLDFGQSDFRLLDRKVLNIIVHMPEYHKFLRGQVSWIGFRQRGIAYDVEKRHAEEPKYSYRTLSRLALDGIFSFGRYPLHLVMLFSLLIFAASSLYIVLVLLIWLLKIAKIIQIAMPPGWTTLTMAVFFLGSIQLMAVGILSEYVGRIYDQAKGRPVFIVREAVQ